MKNKIISMSAFGNDNRYFKGAIRQTELAKANYPDWEVRIYTDNSDKFNDIKNNANIIQIDEDSWGPFWRFAPLFESEDNITIIRDSDDRITIREVLAVYEWIESDKRFHTMKDHEAHFEYPIMAGLFGFKGKMDDTLKTIMKIFKFTARYYLSDQVFLKNYVYPKYNSSFLLHSLHDGWFAETRSKLKNRYCFCGNGYDENDYPIYPDSPGGQVEKIVFDGGKLTD